jgi:hypothetical protein
VYNAAIQRRRGHEHSWPAIVIFHRIHHHGSILPAGVDTKMDGKVVEISEVGVVRSRNGRARRSCFDPTVADITIVDCQ